MAVYQKNRVRNHTQKLREKLNSFMSDGKTTLAQIEKTTGINYRIITRFMKNDLGMCYENGMKIKMYILKNTPK